MRKVQKNKTKERLIEELEALHRHVAELEESKAESKQADEAMKIAYSELDQIFQAAADGTCVIDKDFNILRINEALCNLLFLSKDEAIGKKCYEILGDPRCHTDRCSLTRILSGEDYDECDVEKELSTGTKLSFIVTATPHRRLDGELTGIFKVLKDITEHKEAENAIRESESKLHSIVLSSMADLVFVLDKEGRFTECYAPRSEDLYMPLEELMGRKYSEVMPPYSTKLITEAIKKNKSGEVYECEYPIEIAGKEQWYHVKESPLLIDGQYMGSVSVHRNITERKKVETRLNLLSSVTEQLNDSFIITDTNFKITYINKAATDMFGYKTEELVGKTPDLFNATPLSTKMQQHIYDTVSSGKIYRGTWLNKRKDGTIFTCEFSVNPLIDKQGKIFSYASIRRDITERVRSEKALQESNERIQAIISNTPVVLWSLDKEGIFTLSEGAGLKALGLRSGEVVGRSVFDVSRDLPQILEDNRRALAGERHASIIKAGDLVYESYYSPVRDKSEQVNGMVGVAIDITQLKRAEEKLQKLYVIESNLRRKLEKQIEQRATLIRVLVHELKTPLTPMLGISDYLVANIDDANLLKHAKFLNDSALSLNKRINELFDQTKAEMGILVLKCHRINTMIFLNELIDYVTQKALIKEHTINLDIPQSLPDIWADEDRIQQVLLNLIDNAFKFTPKGGAIIVKARAENTNLIVEVKDNGFGIEKSEQKRLFRTYGILTKDRKPNSGLGLGLSLCKTFVELHGGKIWVKSYKGKGSTFSFSIPLDCNKNPILKGKIE